MLAAAVLSAILIVSFIAITYSPGGYTARPGNIDSDGQNPLTDARATTYGDLPLWIQLAALLDAALLAVGTIGIFSPIIGRIQDLMGNRNRQSIYNYVANNPGCTQAEITARQNMREGTVKYHLLMLETEGRIIRKRMGKFTRLFRNSSRDLEKKVASHLRSDMSRNVLLAILMSPGITNQEYQERFGIEKRAVLHWHIDRFLEDSIIQVVQDGRHKQYFLKDEAKGILLKLTGTGPAMSVTSPEAVSVGQGT